MHKKIGRNLHISPKSLLTFKGKGDRILYCIIMGAYAPYHLFRYDTTNQKKMQDKFIFTVNLQVFLFCDQLRTLYYGYFEY